MKKIALLLTIILLVSGCTVSKRTAYLIVPEAVSDTIPPVDVEKYREALGDFDGIILLSDETIEHSASQSDFIGGSSWNFHHISVERRIVFNPDAPYISSMQLSVEPDTAYMKVTAPDGSVTMYSNTDLVKQKSITGEDEYVFVYPDIRSGTIIEEGWERSFSAYRQRPPLGHDIPLQYTVPVKQLNFTFAYPDWWDIRFKTFPEGKHVPFTQTHDPEIKKRFVRSTRQNVPAWEFEPMAPFYRESAPHLSFIVTPRRSGGVYLGLSSSWNTMVMIYGGFVDEEMARDSADVAELTNRILEDHITDSTKIDAITAFVRDSIGRSGDYEDRGNGDVIEERVGGVFERIVLTCAMLHSAGFDFDYYLLHSATQGYFDPNFVSLDQFGMPAVGRKSGEQLTVLLPTLPNCPVRYVPEQFQGEQAINVTSAGQLYTLPVMSSEQETSHDNYDITISEDGSLRAEHRMEFTGSVAMRYRDSLESLSTTDLEEAIRGGLGGARADADITGWDIDNLSQPDKPLVITRSYATDDLIANTPDEVLFQAAGLFGDEQYRFAGIDTANRTHPVVVRSPQRLSRSVSITLPEHWQTDLQLDSLHFENRFGVIAADWIEEPGRLQLNDRLDFHVIRAEKDAIVEVNELLEQCRDLELSTIIFSKPTVGQITSPR